MIEERNMAVITRYEHWIRSTMQDAISTLKHFDIADFKMKRNVISFIYKNILYKIKFISETRYRRKELAGYIHDEDDIHPWSSISYFFDFLERKLDNE